MIPELPTDANVKPLLAQMLPYYALDDQMGVVFKVAWRDALPQCVLEAMARDHRTWVLKRGENEFLIGYKGSDFAAPQGPVYVPLYQTPNIIEPPLEQQVRMGLCIPALTDIKPSIKIALA